MIKHGKGICTTIHSTGLTGGGDPSEAIVRVHLDGSATVSIGATELGQGIKTVARQLTAEVLGIDPKRVTVMNSDTANTPFDTGQFASRTTLITGNAVKAAAENIKKNILDYTAAKFQVSPGDLYYKNALISNLKNPEQAIALAELAAEAVFVAPEALIGIGRYAPVFSPRDNETGKVDFFKALQYLACVAEVDVDTDTGVVTVTKMTAALEMGRALNPLLLEGQLHGGAAMGLGYALQEDVLPQYPDLKFMRTSFREYHIPTSMDIPEIDTILLENPTPHGPFGAKGCGEIVANAGAPAIISAISDALGVCFDTFPVTPGKILRALSEKEEAEASE